MHVDKAREREPVLSVRDSPPMYDSTTVMRLVVSVPVLSEQIAVAFPIVSQASR